MIETFAIELRLKKNNNLITKSGKTSSSKSMKNMLSGRKVIYLLTHIGPMLPLYRETSQLIYRANQLAGFYVAAIN